MDSGLFITKAEAVKAAIIELATRIEKGELTPGGRLTELK
jgi:hypothetical protein